MFWRANSCWWNRVSFPIVLSGTKRLYTLIQAKHLWKLNLYKFAEFLFPKKQDSGCVGYWVCVPTSTTDLCCQLVMRQIWSKEKEWCFFFLLKFFSTHFASLGGEKYEQKTWKALKVKLMIGLVIEHASFLLTFLPSSSPVAYNLYQWFFLRQILLTKNWESLGNMTTFANLLEIFCQFF